MGEAELRVDQLEARLASLARPRLAVESEAVPGDAGGIRSQLEARQTARASVRRGKRGAELDLADAVGVGEGGKAGDAPRGIVLLAALDNEHANGANVHVNGWVVAGEAVSAGVE